jgi:integrase
MLAELDEIRDRSIRLSPEDWIFADDKGRAIQYRHWRGAFVGHVDALGIDRKGRRLSPHSLRHTLNTLLLEHGANPLLVAQYLGWSQSAAQIPALTPVQGGYTHLSHDALRDILPTIEGLFSG